ncbi:hypothetical protein H2201_000954 [Coniosporium apollinis]|uniref:Cellular morphogenesis protein n=1 Tax=Coniosporium apollinis TaxID=61459 RepID=A0ABQ9P8B8_9PEZI|nr:hypothetical protein H2201_000954 [Coniosporium apollinis]
MREFSSSLGLTVSKLGTLLLTASSCIVPGIRAVQFTRIPSPNLDLNGLGRVAVAGDFDAVSLYQYEGQTEASFSTNGSQSLLSRYPNGAFADLGATDGYIRELCPYVRRDGTMAGVIIGGNFTSVQGIEAQGIALLNTGTAEITPLPGLSGSVAAILCDQETDTVYVGGSFTGGNSTNAIAWRGGWDNLPFAGFNGPVTSITKAPGGNIVFGGAFNGLGNISTPQSGPTPQVIPVGSGNITAGSSTSTVGFGDPRNIVCKTSESDGPNNTWLLADNTPGYWQARYRFGFQPTKLRLYNTQVDGRGTRTWMLTALPLNGIMNLTYTGASGREEWCTNECPLPQNNDTYQDFNFANVVGMNGFRIDISAWYGRGGGLSGIELFQDDIYSFAINDFNQPNCDAVSEEAHSSVTGPWTVTPSGTTNSDYLTARFTGPDIGPLSANVVYQPDIKQPGNYSVTIYTPGCIQDQTCRERGRVNITGIMGSGTRGPSQPITTELFQTNNFDKYDQVYYGYIDPASDVFQPTVTISPAIGQSGPLTIVAQRVRFELLTAAGGLNGLFEFDPNQAVVGEDLSQSNINTAGMDLNAGALVTSLEAQDDTVYVAGNFRQANYSNIFSISGNSTESLPGGGLNSEVSTMFRNGTTLYVGGHFTNTRDNTSDALSGVAAYLMLENTWAPLGAGVNGEVRHIVPLELNITENQPELCIAVTGTFNQVRAFGANASYPVNNFAVWVPGRRNWLRNLGVSTISISGELIAQTDVPGSSPLWSGAISSQVFSVSGSVGLGNSGNSLWRVPANIQPQQASVPSLVEKRALSRQNVTGAATGLIYTENNLNITILGGHFTATASNGSDINNLVFINGSNSDQVTGVGNGLDADSVFLALGTQGTTLFAGGTISGTVNDDEVNGLIAYDLAGANYAPNQPPPLTGEDVAVFAVAAQPNTQSVYVGGSFDSAGDFDCPAMCVYDTARSQWTSPGTGLAGTVGSMTWISNNRLIIGGNLTVGGNDTSLAAYDANTRAFTEFSNGREVPGPVTALTTANSEGTEFWVAGQTASDSAFLQRSVDGGWRSVGDTLGTGTIIRGIQVFSTTSDHRDAAPLLERNQVLLIMGQINVPNFGSASAVLFNGTTFTPFILTTTASNSPGSLSSAFVQNPQGFFNTRSNRLAVGFVVLIGLAIALALIFLLVVAGIVAERMRRKREGYMPVQTQMFDKNTNVSRIPPEHLFGSLRPGGGRSTPARL